MSGRLRNTKSSLTHLSKTLETMIKCLKDEEQEVCSTPFAEGEFNSAAVQATVKQMQERVASVEAYTTKLEQTLSKYEEIYDELNPKSQKEEEDFEAYSDRAQEVLAVSFEYTTTLKARIEGFNRYTQCSRENITTPNGLETTTVAKCLELPTLPVPKFNGKIWEWDNFWQLFTTNVDSQNLSELHKFNYLLGALEGDALEAVKKFKLTKKNYSKAIQFLVNKYGKAEQVILQLIDELDQCSLRSPAIQDQRSLFEHLQVLLMQLSENGENVDNHCIFKKILSKFPSNVQQKVLDKKQAAVKDKPFQIQELIDILEEVISRDEMTSRYLENLQTASNILSSAENKGRTWHRQSNSSCIYCRGNHKPFYCDKYKTPQERYQYLKNNRLCHICASSSHNSFQCKRPPCYTCQRQHHTSCCFYSTPKEKPFLPPLKNEDSKKHIKSKGKKDKMPSSTSYINKVGQETHVQEKSATSLSKGLHSTFLPTGQMTVLDPTTKQLRKISVLLDSGAELSFIDEKLAQELCLPTIEETKLRLNTFGSDNVQEHISRKVPLEVWDSDGEQHSLFLFTHSAITKPCRPPPICPEDVDYIRRNNLEIDFGKNKAAVKPSILLGCDQLWTLIRKDKPHIELPSGLHLLSTRLGHLCTGKLKSLPHSLQKEDNLLQVQRIEEENVIQTEQDDDEMTKWDQYWTLQVQVNTAFISHPETEDDDAAKWEQFWTLESAGTEELYTSEKEEKQLIDQKVWENFNKTIERRADGYYVRLPWKEVPISLPDNRAIALNRLISVWKSLQKDGDLLDMYNGIFEEQLRLNISEEINEEKTPQASRIHYIPHRAVLTPNKNTTKLRIVYDASAHYKGCPSLNDALHRGPVILAELFGVLLRFRIGRIAITADVEKAFLQVRLHEDDRDATRCLWLHDHKSPPSPSNIKTLRFTRVTFGLKTSPFLLTGTIHFHLDQYKQDAERVAELKDNLYVDNLILTVDDLEESYHVYLRTKQIFSDLSMDLREYTSNSADFIAKIASDDKSNNKLPKVLGISHENTNSPTHHLLRKRKRMEYFKEGKSKRRRNLRPRARLKATSTRSIALCASFFIYEWTYSTI